MSLVVVHTSSFYMLHSDEEELINNARPRLLWPDDGRDYREEGYYQDEQQYEQYDQHGQQDEYHPHEQYVHQEKKKTDLFS